MGVESQGHTLEDHRIYEGYYDLWLHDRLVILKGVYDHDEACYGLWKSLHWD